MRSLARLSLLVTLAGSPLGCGDGSTIAGDAGTGGTDAGPRADGSVEIDGGVEVDAGSDVDGGPDVDASSSDDAGTSDTDAAVSASDPSAVGPYTVTHTSTMIDGATAISYVPALGAGEHAPLVILKHGFQLSTANYAVLAERVASHGFIVVGVDTAGGIFGGPTNIDERDASIAAIDWALSGAPFASQVDAEHIAVMGHSRGGKVAVMVAAADARVDAALLLDPVNGCGPGAGYSATCPDVSSAAIAGALHMPVGVMGETNNATGGFMPCAPMAQNYQTIYAGLTAASWAVAWTFTGADHMDFTDDGGGATGGFCTDGPGDDATIRLDVHTMAVAFMRLHLRGDTAMEPWLTGASIPSGITHEGP
jgi:pimeloyl-ACP methyl ester carboxylesterase